MMEYIGKRVYKCFSPTKGEWDSYLAYHCYVVYLYGYFVMVYAGRNGEFSEAPVKIGLAISKDGIEWTKYSGNPILEPEKNLTGNMVELKVYGDSFSRG